MLTAVYIANDKIQTVTGKGTKKSILVKKCCWESLKEGTAINGIITDENAVKDTLVKMWRENELPDKNITLVVEGRGIHHKLIFAPRLKENRMLEFLKGEFSDIEGFENMIFDYSVTENMNAYGGVTVLACMAEPEFIKGYKEMFDELGIKLSRIDTSLNCHIKLARRIESFKNKTFVIASADFNQINLALFVKGKYRFSSTNRLNCERNSKDMPEDIAGMISLINQFNKSQKSGSDITDVYLGGFTDKECDKIKEMGSSLEMNIEKFPSGQGVISECGNFSSAEFINVLGAVDNERS